LPLSVARVTGTWLWILIRRSVEVGGGAILAAAANGLVPREEMEPEGLAWPVSSGR
jgi:hypothetical protein